MSEFRSTVVFFMLHLGASHAVLQSTKAASPPACNNSEIDSMLKRSTVLSTNAGGIRSVMATVEFDDGQGNMCIAGTTTENKFTAYTVRVRDGVNSASCCTPREDLEWVRRPDNGERWNKRVFADVPQSELHNVSFYEVEPPTCTASSHCPLVIELGGGQSIPEAMSLFFCQGCRRMLKVVMVGLLLGQDYDTSPTFVTETFLPWVESYVRQSGKIDATRVFLTSTSRGNEVAMQAALYKPWLFTWAVLTGKFHMNAVESLLRHDAGCFRRAAQTKLKGILFHLGDSDAAITDEDFYPAFTRMIRMAAHSGVSPIMHVYDYPTLPHDITFTTWHEMFDALWTAESRVVE